MAGGRPTKYKKEYCKIAEDLLSLDKPMCAVAAKIGVDEETLTDWQKANPRFSVACKRGRAKGKAVFLDKMTKAAWNPDKHKANNGLINLLAINKYKMVTASSTNKDNITKKVSKKKTVTVKFVE